MRPQTVKAVKRKREEEKASASRNEYDVRKSDFASFFSNSIKKKLKESKSLASKSKKKIASEAQLKLNKRQRKKKPSLNIILTFYAVFADELTARGAQEETVSDLKSERERRHFNWMIRTGLYNLCVL